MGDPAQYAPGQQLPGTVYRVVRHLATGGMGSVYDVEDITVGKRYVLKTLHPQLVSRHDLAKRMEVEARTLAKLQHPNIVDVVTAGLTTDEQRMPFYVMERLNGQNLRVVIEKKGSLEMAHCYRIAIDVLDALEQAHENAVIHRDVKPENIFLHRNANGTTTTKLLDFGIIRLLDAKASHTQGKFIGTLRYASPEQIFGGELGPATDIYSLGIVLYEMIAGRGPFDDVGDAYAIAAAHAQRPPPPLSTFVAVAPRLEKLVMSAIGKTPAERPRDCFTFAGELRRMLREEEAAPKSSTAINVLSSGPPPTHASLPLAGTEPSDSGAQPVTSTEVGMPMPSVPDALGGLAATHRMDHEMGAQTAMAATLASEPGVPPIRDSAPPVVRVGSVGGAKPVIDRNAPTQSSAMSGATQRLAQNGTSVDDGLPPPPPDEAVRAALAQRETLEVPPSSGQGFDPRRTDLVFPPTHGFATGTGPLAGEAKTRPPERGMLLPLLAAAAVGALLVGSALLAVMRPWQHGGAAPSSPASTRTETAAPAEPVPTVPTASPTAVVATAITPTMAPVSPSAIAPAGGVTAAPAAPATRAGAGAGGVGMPTPRTRPDPQAPTSPPARRAPAKPAEAPKPGDIGFD